MVKRILRRDVLRGVPRAQWDPKHPGPLAHQIQARFVDRNLVRYEIVKQTPKRFTTYCRLPSDAQVQAHCTSCPGSRHDKTNLLCPGSRAAVRKLRKKRLYLMENLEKTLEGRWKQVEMCIPERYRTGTAVFVRA